MFFFPLKIAAMGQRSTLSGALALFTPVISLPPNSPYVTVSMFGSKRFLCSSYCLVWKKKREVEQKKNMDKRRGLKHWEHRLLKGGTGFGQDPTVLC